jgi:hypothetical protein
MAVLTNGHAETMNYRLLASSTLWNLEFQIPVAITVNMVTLKG